MQRKRFRVLLLVFCFCALLSVFWYKAEAGQITPSEPSFTSNRNGTVPPVWMEVKGDKYQWATKATDVEKQQCFTCHPFKQDEPGLTQREWDMDVHVKVKGTFQCEACHGPGSMHVDANSPQFIVNPTDLPKPQQNEMCQACHLQGEVSFHSGADLSCLDCHQFHSVMNPMLLKKLPERELCYQCHAEVRSQFDMYSHHPVNEGIMSCTDCHQPHFQSAADYLKGSPAILGSRNEIENCAACHAREAGPYVTSPTAIEGCFSCHTPHGSPVDNLLKYQEPALCIKCHSPSWYQHELNPVRCDICHYDIHGSDHMRMLFN